MKRRVLGLLLFLSIVPFIMGCDQATTTVVETTEATTTVEMTTEVSTTEATTIAALGLVTIEIYEAGDDPATTEVETEFVSSTVEVSYYEGDTLYDLLDANFTMVIETATFGRYIVSIDSIVPGDSEYVSFFINGEYAMTGIDDTPLTDGDVYQFKLGSF